MKYIKETESLTSLNCRVQKPAKGFEVFAKEVL